MRSLAAAVALATLVAAPAFGQSSNFDVGAHLGADVAQLSDGQGWRGGAQLALAIDQRFGTEGPFLTGIRTHTGKLGPFFEVQLQSPGDLNLRIGVAARWR